jgi:hypothetical protein
MVQCFICGESDSRVLILEKHHIFGKKYSKQAVWVCLNCHKKITDGQNNLPTSIRKSSSSKAVTIFAIRSIGELMNACGEELIKISNKLAEEWKK